MIRAIDISRAQGHIDHARVAEAGIKAVWIKASQGTARSDGRKEYLRENAAAFRRVGIRVGAYHFAEFKEGDSIGEASNFLAATRGVELDLPPCLDVEPHGTGQDWGPSHLTRGELRDWVALWLYAHPSAIIYTPLRSYLDSLRRLGRPMWLASRPWGTSTPPEDIDELMRHRPEGAWDAWQYASKAGRVPGIDGPVDLDLVRAI